MTSKIPAAKVIAIYVLLSCGAAAQDKAAVRAALAACGPANVRFKVRREKSQHPAPAPEKGKARLYLMGDSTFAVDGQWVGASHADTYFSVSLEPGVHHVCARFSHWLPYFWLVPIKVTSYSLHSLDAQADGTYYLGLRGYPYPTYIYFVGPPVFLTTSPPPEPVTRAAPVELVQYDADEGVRIVASSAFGTSRPK